MSIESNHNQIGDSLKTPKRGAIISIIIGATLLVGAIFTFVYSQINKSFYKEASATIVDIYTYSEYDEKIKNYKSYTDVYVDYTVDEEIYKNRIWSEYSRSMAIGDIITITYDSRTPDTPKVMSKIPYYISLGLVIVGIIPLTTGVLLLIFKKKKVLSDINNELEKIEENVNTKIPVLEEE